MPPDECTYTLGIHKTVNTYMVTCYISHVCEGEIGLKLRDDSKAGKYTFIYVMIA